MRARLLFTAACLAIVADSSFAQPGEKAPPAKDAQGDRLPAGARLRLGATRFRTIGGTGRLAMSADGKWLAAVESIIGGVSLFNANTGKAVPLEETESCTSVALSADGRWLAAGHYRKISFWDLATSKKTKSLERPPFPDVEDKFFQINSLAFSPDGKLVAAGHTDNSITLWDCKTDKVVRHLLGHKGWVDQLAFTADSKKLVSGSWDNTTRVWDVESGKTIRTIDESFIAVTGEGNMIATSAKRSNTLFLRRPDGELIHKIEVPGAFILRGAFSKDGSMVAVNSSALESHVSIKEIHLFDTRSGKLRRTLTGNPNGGWPVMFSPDGELVVSGSMETHGNTIRFWNAATGQRVRDHVGHENAVMSVAYSPKGDVIFTAGADGVVRAWDATTGRPKETLAGHTERIWCMSLSRDGQLLATESSDRTVRIWDVAKSRTRFTISFETHPQRLLFSPDAKWLTVGTTDGDLRLYSPKTGKQERTLCRMPKEPTTVAYSPDGALLAWGGYENDIRLVDTASGKEVRRLKGHSFWLRGLAFAPSGQWLASASDDGSARLWELKSNASHLIFQEPEKRQLHSVAAVSFSADGALIATAHHDGNVRIWESVTRRKIAELSGHAAEAHTLAFAPDGRSLVSGSYDTTALVWDLPAICIGPDRPEKLDAKAWDSLWTDLGSLDAVKGQRAVWMLMAQGEQGVTFLDTRRKTMPGAAKLEPKQLDALFTRIDSAVFAERAKAIQEMESLGLSVLPPINQRLKGKMTPESRRRLEQIVQTIEELGEKQRWKLLRIAQALELGGTQHAQEVMTRYSTDGWEPEAFDAARKRLSQQR